MPPSTSHWTKPNKSKIPDCSSPCGVKVTGQQSTRPFPNSRYPTDYGTHNCNMKHDPTCTRCKCNSCQRDRRRSLQHIIDDGGPEAFNVLMETSTSDAERQNLMGQAQGICDMFEYVYSWKFVRHLTAFAIIFLAVAWWIKS